MIIGKVSKRRFYRLSAGYTAVTMYLRVETDINQYTKPFYQKKLNL